MWWHVYTLKCLSSSTAITPIVISSNCVCFAPWKGKILEPAETQGQNYILHLMATAACSKQSIYGVAGLTGAALCSLLARGADCACLSLSPLLLEGWRLPCVSEESQGSAGRLAVPPPAVTCPRLSPSHALIWAQQGGILWRRAAKNSPRLSLAPRLNNVLRPEQPREPLITTQPWTYFKGN